MKILRVLSLFSLLIVSATTIAAQTPTTPSSITQPAPFVQPTPVPQSELDKKLMSEQDRQKIAGELENEWEKYTSKGNWYLALYYILAIGAAVCGGLAGLVLQWDTPEKHYKRYASILAFLGAALVTVMTYVDFSTNARANKAAANQTRRLKFQVQRGEFKDAVDVHERMQEIYEQKQILGLPKSPSAAATP